MPTTPIRVLIVDDHAMVRRGLAAFLKAKPDLQLVGEACNGGEAITLCEQLQPDIVLMDLVMPETNGVAATRTIRSRWPSVQVIALTSFGEQGLVREVLAAGALELSAQECLRRGPGRSNQGCAQRSFHAGG